MFSAPGEGPQGAAGSTEARRPSLWPAPLPGFVTLEALPGPEAIATHQTYLLPVGLVVASAFAIGLGILAYLARSRKIRNRELAAEIERRKDVEQELSRVVAALLDHVWSAELTPDGFEAGYFSSVIARITGHPVETFRNSMQPWYETVHEDDVELLQRMHRELLGGSATASTSSTAFSRPTARFAGFASGCASRRRSAAGDSTALPATSPG
jgi:hypothetical protein